MHTYIFVKPINLTQEPEKRGSITRNKSLELPKLNTEISFKNSNLVALKAYNKLNKDLKTLNVKPEKLNEIIKTWVIDSR